MIMSIWVSKYAVAGWWHMWWGGGAKGKEKSTYMLVSTWCRLYLVKYYEMQPVAQQVAAM